jgi:hypothetical protein
VELIQEQQGEKKGISESRRNYRGGNSDSNNTRKLRRRIREFEKLTTPELAW